MPEISSYQRRRQLILKSLTLAKWELDTIKTKASNRLNTTLSNIDHHITQAYTDDPFINRLIVKLSKNEKKAAQKRHDAVVDPALRKYRMAVKDTQKDLRGLSKDFYKGDSRLEYLGDANANLKVPLHDLCQDCGAVNQNTRFCTECGTPAWGG